MCVAKADPRRRGESDVELNPSNGELHFLQQAYTRPLSVLDHETVDGWADYVSSLFQREFGADQFFRGVPDQQQSSVVQRPTLTRSLRKHGSTAEHV
jgi:hypothetical protein